MNIQKMMQQAQQMQQKMAAMQEEVEKLEMQGKAGGGMVAVTLTGKGKMTSISIDDSLLAKDEKEVLEDLIIAAHNDATSKLEDEKQKQMSEATSGMNLPAGMKLPF